MSGVPQVPGEAQDDIEAAALWYEEQREGLGARFIVELDGVLDRIGRSALQFPLLDPPVRRALLHRFPYAVYFVAEASGGQPVVLAVLHQHRDPDAWRSRL
jgi:plasmid stabilization system protein ParE